MDAANIDAHIVIPLPWLEATPAVSRNPSLAQEACKVSHICRPRRRSANENLQPWSSSVFAPFLSFFDPLTFFSPFCCSSIFAPPFSSLFLFLVTDAAA